MSTEITFVGVKPALQTWDTLFVVGRRERLTEESFLEHLPEGAQPSWTRMVSAARPADVGDGRATWIEGGTAARELIALVLPEPCSRHNAPARPHAIAKLIGAHRRPGRSSVLLALDDPDHAIAAGNAVARAHPLYTRKAPATDAKESTLQIAMVGPDGEEVLEPRLPHVAAGTRHAARLVDQPTNELDTDALVDAAREVANDLGAGCEVLRGDALADRGFGGLWNVGRAASKPPALVLLSHAPDADLDHVVWVGKGIVYDTGGLSLKTKEGMPGMKRDMAGAAAVLGAFQAAVKSGHAGRLSAILCLAENAVGPGAYRPDDVITLYSGKTVEVNNTDAEGRLVLGDGLAYATKHLQPSLIVDLATLTGAQLISTGRRHAAIMTNDPAWEERFVSAGRITGDLVHPLPFCPEFFRAEFKSEVADLKNSVKDRMNAQSSCAGQFLHEHLVDYDGPWVHVDIAGPARSEERATGFGVALLTQLLLEVEP